MLTLIGRNFVEYFYNFYYGLSFYFSMVYFSYEKINTENISNDFKNILPTYN